jgi:hypothetical protein
VLIWVSNSQFWNCIVQPFLLTLIQNRNPSSLEHSFHFDHINCFILVSSVGIEKDILSDELDGNVYSGLVSLMSMLVHHRT